MRETGHDLTLAEISKGYASIARKVSMPKYFYPTVASYLWRNFPQFQTSSLLDVGCGNGFLLKLLSESSPALRLYGIDVSLALTRNATNLLNTRATVVCGSVLDLPFTSGFFDLISVTEVIEHVNDPHRFLEEVARVLIPGGFLVMTFPNANAYHPFWLFAEKHIRFKLLRDVFLPCEHPLKTFQPIDTMYTLPQVIELLHHHNLEVINVEGHEYVPFLTSEIPLWRRFYRVFLQPSVESLFRKFPMVDRAYRVFITAKRP